MQPVRLGFVETLVVIDKAAKGRLVPLENHINGSIGVWKEPKKVAKEKKREPILLQQQDVPGQQSLITSEGASSTIRLASAGRIAIRGPLCFCSDLGRSAWGRRPSYRYSSTNRLRRAPRLQLPIHELLTVLRDRIERPSDDWIYRCDVEGLRCLVPAFDGSDLD